MNEKNNITDLSQYREKRIGEGWKKDPPPLPVIHVTLPGQDKALPYKVKTEFVYGEHVYAQIIDPVHDWLTYIVEFLYDENHKMKGVHMFGDDEIDEVIKIMGLEVEPLYDEDDDD